MSDKKNVVSLSDRSNSVRHLGVRELLEAELKAMDVADSVPATANKAVILYLDDTGKGASDYQFAFKCAGITYDQSIALMRYAEAAMIKDSGY